MTRVACIGEAMIELSTVGDTAALGVAGDTLNTAIYLKRSAPDLTVDFVTRLSDDPFSDRIRNFIASEGIGTGQVATDPGTSPGLYAITVDAGGERSFTYWRSHSPARNLFSDGDFSVLNGYDLIYLSGITLAIMAPAARNALTVALHQTVANVAFDGNYRPRLWESPMAAHSAIGRLQKIADLNLPSIDDEMTLTGNNATEVEERFADMQCSGALKRGADGPLSLGEPVNQSYPPAPIVIDTTAAGDSFNGGYLAAVLSGKTQADALMAGHTLASKVIAHRGAIIPKEDM